MIGHRAKRPHHHRASGFTLIDMVMVLSILGVVTAIAVPRFGSGMSRYQLDAAARRVVADLEWARAEAMAQSTTIEVQFEFQTHRYVLKGVESINRDSVDNAVALSEEPYNAQIISAFGKNIGDATHSMFFDMYGKADQTGTIEVKVGGDSLFIDVDSETGKVALQ